MIEIDGSIVRGLGSNIERDRKNYTEVVVFCFYVPTLRTLACRMIGRRTAALNQFPALISQCDSDWNRGPRRSVIAGTVVHLVMPAFVGLEQIGPGNHVHKLRCGRNRIADFPAKCSNLACPRDRELNSVMNGVGATHRPLTGRANW